MSPGTRRAPALAGRALLPLRPRAPFAPSRSLSSRRAPCAARSSPTARGRSPRAARCSSRRSISDHAARVATLDAQGRFTVAGLPRGRWRVEVSVPGLVLEGERVLDAKGAATDELSIRVARTGQVTGTVVDPAGAPVAGATIVLRQQVAGPGVGVAAPVRSLEDRPALASTRLRWVHPLAGPRQMPVIAPARFGAHRPGHRAAECGLGHCGVDIGSKRGTIVHAAADGDVTAAFTDIRGEAGRFVAVDHGGGLRTYYMHLDELRGGLEVGQKIRAGDPVGTIGTTGFALEAPHLHFALTQEHHGRAWYVDPEPILRHAVVLASARSLDPIDGAGAATEPDRGAHRAGHPRAHRRPARQPPRPPAPPPRPPLADAAARPGVRWPGPVPARRHRPRLLCGGRLRLGLRAGRVAPRSPSRAAPRPPTSPSRSGPACWSPAASPAATARSTAP